MTMHHLDAERAILAATFLSRAVVDRLILDHALQPQDFDQPHHQRTWHAILTVHARGAKVDPIILGDLLGATVPPGFVQELPGWADAISSIGEHAQIVKRHALRRSWHAAAQRLIEASDTDNEQLVAQAEALLAAPTGTDETWTPERLGEDVCDFLTDKGSVGVSTGMPKLDDLLAGGLRPGDMTAIGAWTSMGKALDVTTPVPTPTGWTTMADLKPGDRVYGSDGQPTRIIAATDVMAGRPCYRLRFDDGTEIVADEQHLWMTWTDAARRSASTARRLVRAGGPYGREQDRTLPSVVTTGEIAATATVESRGGRSNHSVLISTPFQAPPMDLPVDPYVLGAWLGDGASRAARITSADPELLGFIAEAGHPVKKYVSRYDYGIGGLQAKLRVLGLLQNKHIPDAYQHASVDQRLALMQGLMDTDGTVGRLGRCEFAVTSEVLARDFHALAVGLGLKPTWAARPAMLNGRECGTQYRVGFVTVEPVCRLSRKRQRLPVRVSDKARHRYIVSVERVESRPVRCIQVAATDGLFQVSRSRVLTHNSVLVDTFLHDAALEGRSCHVYVNEMSPRDRTLRTLARMGAAPYAQLARRDITKTDAPRVLDAAKRIPFGVTDCSQWDAAQIGRHARANRWDLWCVDLVHNMAYERESELHQIVATLAAAARSSNSHLLLVAQFNEARAIGETLPVPVARDIRGSGMIKNLSANVLLLHREQTNQGGFVTTSRDGILKVEKSRHGQLGMVPVTFHPDEMRFKGGRSLEAVAPLRVVRKDTA